MKRSTLRASKEHKTIAQFRIACIQENGVPLDLLKKYLTKYFHWPDSIITSINEGKEPSFECLQILKRIDDDSFEALDKKQLCLEITNKIIKEVNRVRRFACDSIAANEPCGDQLVEHVSAYYEWPNDSNLTDYADKHGI